MKRLFFALLLSLSLATSASAGNYNVTISRTGQDIYTTLTGNIIITMYCYEFVYTDSAVLLWNYPLGMSIPYGGKLIFASGTICDVTAVY